VRVHVFVSVHMCYRETTRETKGVCIWVMCVCVFMMCVCVCVCVYSLTSAIGGGYGQQDRLNHRSLLQNIVSFIGLFCKRDLERVCVFW